MKKVFIKVTIILLITTLFLPSAFSREMQIELIENNHSKDVKKVVEPNENNKDLILEGFVSKKNLEGGFYAVKGYRLAGDKDFSEYEGKYVKVIGTLDTSPSIFMTKAINVIEFDVIEINKENSIALSQSIKKDGKFDVDDILVFTKDGLIEFDTMPLIKNNRTMVPMRKLGESLGLEVKWDIKNNKAIFTKGNRIVKLTINESTALINNNEVKLDSPAIIVNGRTFAPLRFVAEAFEIEPIWDKDSRTIWIN